MEGIATRPRPSLAGAGTARTSQRAAARLGALPRSLPGKFRRGFEAVGHGDVDTILAFLDPAIEWDMSCSFPDGRVYHGHRGVRQFFADVAKLWREFRLEIDEIEELGAHGDQVLVIGWWCGRGRASDVPLRSRGAWLWDMEGQRARRMRFFFDVAQARRAAKLAS